MAMMGGMGMRTIWITLRAVNYTERIFREVIRGVGKLSDEQRLLNQEQLQSLRIGNALIMTGMMLSSVGIMMLQNLGQLAFSTREGAIEMSLLKKEMEEAKVAMADTIYEFMKMTGILDRFRGTLEAISKRRWLRQTIVLFIGIAGAVLILAGGMMVLAGAIKSYYVIAKALPKLLAILNVVITKHGLIVRGASISWTMAAASIGIAMAALYLVITITDKFGKVAGVVTGLAMAVIGLALAFSFLKAVLTGGASLAMDVTSAVGVGLMAGGIMGALYAGTRQMGTRSLAKTGFVYGHKHEVIYNPTTHRPTQVGNDLDRAEAGRRRANFYDMNIVIENVHTKADFDDMDRKIQRSIAKAMKNKE